ncbi:hypothetical protein MLD38_017490 [Melastoma candidum]|uniref:Uncharacterized protein n=1 Tax=Melastoma candidum TaxID=119954 RepID=A0ACB9QQV8_9MYRT|nr:hypothetical protein MLD38_017490 [Melastoma candidum]
MSSGSTEVETCRKHRRSATPPDDVDELDRMTSSKKHKHHRSDSGGGEMADEGVDLEVAADEPGEVPGDNLGDSPVDVPRPLPDDLEEGEILDEGGMFSATQMPDAEAALIAMESNATGGTSNGDLVSDFSIVDDKKKVYAAYKSSLGEKSQYVDDNEMDTDSAIRYSMSGILPYSDRYEHDRVDSSSHLRDGSHSIPREEDALFKGRWHLERDPSYNAGRHRGDYDSDDRRTSSLEKKRRHGSRDKVKDSEQDRVSSHSRYDYKDDRHHVRYGSRDRGSSREIDQGRKREERERSRDRDVDKDKKRNYRERSTDWEDEMDSRREKRRDRGTDKEIDDIRRREKERDRNGESERNKDRRMERRRDRSRDRVLDKDRKREKEDDWTSDEKIKKDRRGEKERDRNYVRETESRRDRDRDREREREKLEDLYRERSRKSSREKSEDRKRSERKDSRHVSKHESHEDTFSRRDLKKDNVKYEDTGKLFTDCMESTKDSQGRDEDELDDSEENLSFSVPEQEEDHLNKIKEESRRLRQAILEKYMNKQQQGQKVAEAQLADVVVGRTIISSKPGAENPGEVADGGEDYVVEPLFSVGKSPSRNETAVAGKAYGERGLGEGTPKSERSADMFRDEIFGDSPACIQKPDKVGGELVEKSGLNDNWDDAEGYYCYSLGEKLDGRYEVIAAHGKGVFSTVVRAKDANASVGEPKEVAIKILRSKEAMYKAGVQELGILNKLVGADPEDKRHCVRLLSSFKLTAVRAYAKQLFIALKHLRNCGVLHCDIKPDNMLVNEAKNVLKLCDFGNAMYAGKNEITPYLVSRFYRAPEIILGLPYDHPVDIWSVGCCLYELYTGKVLFPGATNNDMLRLHMELKGPFPKKMLRKGAFTDQHFDQDLNFLATEEDPVTKKAIKRMILNIKPKDIGSIIKGSSGEDPNMLANFKDILDKIFMLDPDKRMTVQQALSHPFITGK